MKKPYLILAYAPHGDAIRFLLTYQSAGIRESVSAAMRQSERLQRKVTRIMDRPPHVTPLQVTVTAGSGRHRRHLQAVAAGLAAGLALVLAALVTWTAFMFWAGYGLAAAVWLGGHLWCLGHKCRPPEREG